MILRNINDNTLSFFIYSNAHICINRNINCVSVDSCARCFSSIQMVLKY